MFHPLLIQCSFGMSARELRCSTSSPVVSAKTIGCLSHATPVRRPGSFRLIGVSKVVENDWKKCVMNQPSP